MRAGLTPLSAEKTPSCGQLVKDLLRFVAMHLEAWRPRNFTIRQFVT